QLTVTIGKFYRVTGESTQHRGVEPDVELASPIRLKDVGESALDDALPWDRIDRAEFRALDTRLPSIAKLALEENSRQKRDPDYRWLVEDIAALNRLRDQSSISLNIEKRRAERTMLETNRLSRENARRVARAESPLSSIEALDVSKQPDVVLDQSAEVMVDMLKLSEPSKSTKPKTVTAKREAA
ncbi:MAG: hypothetical protein RL597_488, partial [Pseudomonadota bacterium]